MLGIKREHQTTEYAQMVVKAIAGKEKGIEVEELDVKAPGALSFLAVLISLVLFTNLLGLTMMGLLKGFECFVLGFLLSRSKA